MRRCVTSIDQSKVGGDGQLMGPDELLLQCGDFTMSLHDSSTNINLKLSVRATTTLAFGGLFIKVSFLPNVEAILSGEGYIFQLTVSERLVISAAPTLISFPLLLKGANGGRKQGDAAVD
jgi:hypothetical protein